MDIDYYKITQGKNRIEIDTKKEYAQYLWNLYGLKKSEGESENSVIGEKEGILISNEGKYEGESENAVQEIKILNSAKNMKFLLCMNTCYTKEYCCFNLNTNGCCCSF